MGTGKRVIAAGPGNPPVLVDPCADLDQAARDVVAGASFDNNLLCIGEKEVFVVERAAAEFMAALKRARAVLLDERQVEALTRAAFTFDEKGGKRRAHVKGELVGRDPAVLAEAAGFRVPEGTELLFGETPEEHPFVQEEQMMPFLPIVRVRDTEAGIEAARRAEHGYRHTALIHSRKLENVTEMARVLEHDALRAQRALLRRPRARRAGIPELLHRHPHRRGRHDAPHLHAAAADHPAGPAAHLLR